MSNFISALAASSAVEDTVNRLRPAVTQVTTSGSGVGTGIILTHTGQVLTNAHVVADGRGIRRNVAVVLSDQRTFPARVVRIQPDYDLALLQIDANDLPVATLGDSRRLRVGELVFAIGNPWGRINVVTSGIVSGVGVRLAPETLASSQDKRIMIPYIRSDVRLAPGNSGGPLLNACGQVVGINAMIWGGDLSIAIPSATASAWLTEPEARPAGTPVSDKLFAW